MDWIFLLLSVAALLSACQGLECYTCQNMEKNKGDCVEKVEPCDQGQSRCTSIVSWKSPQDKDDRYGRDRDHYISKGCDTEEGCASRMQMTQTTCKRDWYHDWTCVECCSGDLCNYYVTLAGHTFTAQAATIFSLVCAALLLTRL